MKKLVLIIMVFLSCGAFALPSQDTLPGYPEHRVFEYLEEYDRMVIGKTDNTLFGTPRNDGESQETGYANTIYFQNNRYEMTRIYDLAFTLERLEEIAVRDRRASIFITPYFSPDGQVKEVYFLFRGYGGTVPLTPAELERLETAVRHQIRGWYRYPGNHEEQLLQNQHYIEFGLVFPVLHIIEYKMGLRAYGATYSSVAR